MKTKSWTVIWSKESEVALPYQYQPRWYYSDDAKTRSNMTLSCFFFAVNALFQQDICHKTSAIPCACFARTAWCRKPIFFQCNSFFWFLLANNVINTTIVTLQQRIFFAVLYSTFGVYFSNAFLVCTTSCCCTHTTHSEAWREEMVWCANLVSCLPLQAFSVTRRQHFEYESAAPCSGIEELVGSSTHQTLRLQKPSQQISETWLRTLHVLLPCYWIST